MKVVQLNKPKTILGTSTTTKHAIENNPAEGRIAPLWQSFLQKGATNSIPEAKSQAIYAVYNNYESDLTGTYKLTLGAESDTSTKQLEQAKIPTGTYLVFEASGPSPQCTIDAWQAVWAYFANETSSYKRSYTTDFEIYTSNEGVSIYINID